MSVRPTKEAMETLLRLHREYEISYPTILLYMFFCVHDGETVTIKTIKEDTGLGNPTIKKHSEILEILGAVKLDRPPQGSKKGMGISASPHLPYPPSHTINSINSIINIKASKSSYYNIISNNDEGGGVGEVKKSNNGKMGLKDIEVDPDWIKIHAILSKYFKRFEIMPNALVKKNRFMELLDLYIDEEFPFEEYAKWFQRVKYPTTKFNFGLFLYPGLVEEFKEYWESEVNYKHTRDNKRFEEGAKRTKKSLRKYRQYENLSEEDILESLVKGDR
jgi:hypothetical protein